MPHFYLQDGTPFYKVPYADPKKGMRNATITDARKVGAYPSVSAILDIPRKYLLEVWKINQGILAALANPHINSTMEEKEILSILRKEAQKEAIEAAEIGTAIHDATEAHFLKKPIPDKFKKRVANAVALLDKHCGKQNWQTEKWFASPLGYGGKIDLISPEWTIDFKSKPGDADEHKMYEEQLIQLVAYDKGTWESSTGESRRKANIIISRDNDSAAFWDWSEQKENNQEKAWAKFKILLQYWHTDKEYFPHLPS